MHPFHSQIVVEKYAKFSTYEASDMLYFASIISVLVFLQRKHII